MNYRPPSDEHEFEEFCLLFFRRYLDAPSLDRFGRRGQRQYGIDLLELAASAERRAIQCKHHGVGAVATAQELQEEVQKAKGFGEKVDEYYFVTTAPRDTDLQLAVLKINEEHLKSGDFSVVLWTWEAFERELDKDPVAARLLPGPPIQTAAMILADVVRAEVKNAIADGVLAAGAEIHDASIDAGRDLLVRGESSAAKIHFEGMRSRLWDVLSPRQRFRVLANLGAALIRLDRPLEGAQLYHDAAALQPNDPDARAFSAIAYDLLGDREKSFSIAQELVVRERCKRAAVVYLRTAPESEPFATLADNVSQWADERAIFIELAVRGLNHGEYDLGYQMASKFGGSHGSEPWGFLFAGKALLLSQLAPLHVGHKGEAQGLSRQKLLEADRQLSMGIERCSGPDEREAKGQGLLDRAHVRGFLGAREGESSDLEEASRLIPENVDLLVSRAVAVMDRDEPLGLRLLREASARARDGRPAMILAGELARRAATREEAHRLFLHVADSTPSLKEDAIIRAVETLIKDGRFEDADALVAERNDTGACLAATIKAAIALARGDRQIASSLTADALKIMQGDESAALRRSLATTLQELSEFGPALRILRTLAAPGLDSPDLRALLNCARRVADHSLILEHCRKLRENSVLEYAYVELETSLLQLSDPEACYQVLRQYLDSSPSDKRATLRLSVAAWRIGRLGEVVTDISRLPPPDSPLEVAQQVAKLLVVVGHLVEAKAYSYETVRAHWGEADAHRGFITLCLTLPDDSRPPTPSEVGPGTAVRFVEQISGAEQWLVIEDGPTVHTLLNEVRADSVRALPFLGRKVRERFSLTKGIQDREVEIVEILDKVTYRVRDCMNNYQVWNPDRQDIQAVALGPDSTPVEQRLEPVVRAVEARAEKVRALLEAYARSPLPLAFMADELGDDPVRCQLALVLGKQARVWAAAGDQGSYADGVQAAAVRGAVVLDASAVASILLLKLVDRVASLGWRILVSYSTREMISGFAKANENRREEGRLSRGADGLVFEKADPALWAGLASDAVRLATLCQAVPAPRLATLLPGERDQLVQLHHQWGAETVCASVEDDRVVWTDDATVAVSVRQHGGIALGTQGIFDAATARGTATTAERDDTAARLVGFGYLGIWVSPSVVKAACRASSCDPAVLPLESVVNLVGVDTYPLKAAVALSVVVLRETWISVALPERRTAFATVLLERLGKRTDSSVLLAVLRGAIEPAFGLDVLSAADVLDVLDRWSKLRSRKLW